MKNDGYNFLKNIEKPLAIIFGNDSVSILGLIRNFQKGNIPTIVLTSKTKKQIFSFSKYCISITCPDPIINEKEFIDFLLNIGKEIKLKGVLFPTNDNDLYLLLKHRALLEEYFIFPIADLNIVDKLLNKHKFYMTLEELDIPHPKTYFPNTVDELSKISEEISFPCIIKPAYSGYFRYDFQKKFFIVRNKEELKQYFTIGINRNHKLIIQEIILGNTNNQYGLNAFYDKNHNSHGIFMYNKIREWPDFGGVGCYLESVEIPELEKITTSLIKNINYYGIVDVEFKKDPKDNTYKLIEINPRVWLENSLPTRYGLNIPYLAYIQTIGKNEEKCIFSKNSVKWFNLYEDVPAVLYNIKKGTLNFNEWIKSYKGKKEYAIFTGDDPLPAFVLFVNFIFIDFPFFLIRYIKRHLFKKRTKNSL
jgi:D-aspartate ligase